MLERAKQLVQSISEGTIADTHQVYNELRAKITEYEDLLSDIGYTKDMIVKGLSYKAINIVYWSTKLEEQRLELTELEDSMSKLVR